MNIQDFFQYKTNCPICKTTLSTQGQLTIMMDRDKDDSFFFAGYLLYSWKDNKFHKQASHFDNDYRKLGKIALKVFPSTFSINKRFTPNLNKNFLNKLLFPWYLNSFDLTISRNCDKETHSYHYNSHYIEPNQDIDLQIAEEILDVHNYRIYNNFQQSAPKETSIHDKTKITKDYDFIQKIKQYEENTIPFINMERWNTTSNKTLKHQIEKILLLK